MYGMRQKIARTFLNQTMDTTCEMGIIVSGSTDSTVMCLRDNNATHVEGDCLIFLHPHTR